ncbi:MAG: phycobilisome rod-core linker polypeptide [Cyanobacteria bacterium P01_D01_bin.123]
MAIPLLSYAPTTQNARVVGYDVLNDDTPRIYSTESLTSPEELGELIDAAYRQIYFHAFAADREVFLESQLKFGQISVRDFIRGLLLSDRYRRSFFDLNSNYRLVEQTVQRTLGRDVYNEAEKLAWSIVIATKGFEGFVDDLLNSEEYMENFGYNTLPYQRRRTLTDRSTSELPFNIKSPRYDDYYRGKFGFPQIIFEPKRVGVFKRQEKSGDPALYLAMARGLTNSKGTGVAVTTDKMDYLSLVPRR